MTQSSRRRVLVTILAVTALLGAIPATATAQTGGGGTIVVEEGDTVSEVSAVAGTVIVRGTVTGDVSVLAGNVQVEEGGTVEGSLSAAAGNVRIGGTVQGDVSAGAGDIRVEEGGTVGGDFEVGAGNVFVGGTIEGDATIGAETIRLGESASIAGSLTYDGRLEGNTDAVQGEITQDPTLGLEILGVLQPLAAVAFAFYAFLFNLLLGALLLFLFPDFSRGVAERVANDPARTGAIGLAAVIGIVLLMIALAVTVIGIPFSLLVAIVFGLLAWIALVYGRFAVGAWLLSLADIDNRWAALVVGLLVGAALSWIPIVGWVAGLVIFLLGFGAVVRGLTANRRRRADVAPSAPDSGSVPED